MSKETSIGTNSVVSKLFNVIAIVASLFHLYILVTGGFQALVQRPLHWALLSCMIFLKYPYRKGKPLNWWANYLPAILTIIPCVYLAINQDRLMSTVGRINDLEIMLGLICVVLVFEAGRRTMGLAFPIIALCSLFYAVFGYLFPGMLAHKGYGLQRIIQTLVYTGEGIFGVPIKNSVTYIAGFVIFGEVLSICGISKAFADVAGAITRGMRGSAAKAATIASALFGMISGGAVTNVMLSGVFTIPWMKRTGYKPSMAGAVEAVASSGGQIMPPIMGAAAFLIADFLGITYPDVVKVAILPAILYFAVCFIQVDLYAARHMDELDQDASWSDDSNWTALKKNGIRFIPIVVLLAQFAAGSSMFKAVLWSMVSAPFCRWIVDRKFLNLEELRDILVNSAKGLLSISAACAIAGILIAMLQLTGLTGIFAVLIKSLSGGNVWIALFITMVTCVILGMGMPTTAAYIVLATLGAPALVEMGLEPIAAHFFIFYFACLAPITPPVALSSYAAAALAEENPWKVSMEAVKMAFPIFLIPFMFAADPGLLLHGPILNSLYNFFTALVGIFCFASAAQGYCFGDVKVWHRVLLVGAGATLMIPGVVTDLVGMVLALVVIVPLFMRSLRLTRANS